MCISDMYSAYQIHTCMYSTVSACICMYLLLPRDVSCAYLNVSSAHEWEIQADTCRYALPKECISACICLYLPVFHSRQIDGMHKIHTDMHSIQECISVCICLYLPVFLSRIPADMHWIHTDTCIRFVWFIAPVRPPAGPSNHLAGNGTADAAAGLVHPHRRAVVARSPRGHSGSAGAGEKNDTFIWITATAWGNLNSRAVARWSALVHLPVVYLEAKE